MKMILNIFTITILTALLFTSCKETPEQENTKETYTEILENDSDNVVKTTSTDTDGNKLEMLFDNTKGTATLNFKGETIELDAQKSASGIWYKNENYELRGKGNDIQLKKNDTVIFEHQDDTVHIEAKNKKGDVLNMTFNNTEGTVKAYLNGGEQIDLVEEKAASGIWYKNDHCELRGKGDSYTLNNDGKTVFKN